MEEIIRVENLTHTYGAGTPFCRSAVQDMSLDIYRGEFLGIIGHTGSGKSTLIQHLNGLLKPTTGRILLGGKDIWADPKKIRDVRFRVGLVFQYPEYQLFEETVYRDIAFGPTNMGLSKEEIGVVLDEVGISACLTARQIAKIMQGIYRSWDDAVFTDYLTRLAVPADKKFKEFSRGMKMKLGIAVALSHHPRLLILDEATSGLDPVVRDEVMDIFNEFTRDENHAILILNSN